MLKKINKILLTFAIVSFVTILTGCIDNTDNQSDRDVNVKAEKEKLEEANRNWLKQEKEAINEYINKVGLEFVETGTGMRYRVVNQGDGALIKTGDVVAMEYELSLLNGDLISSSDDEGIKVFRTGIGGVESGLEEAVLNLHYGDEAVIIIPSYLAHGLTGDGNKIPPRATLVYKMKIIDNQK